MEWIPPAGPLELFRRNSIGLTGGLESIFARLNAGQPLILGMMLSKAFFRPAPGSVIDAEEPPIPAMRHAVIAVGHGTTSDKRFILIRNSWGEEWGDADYAWVSERYLAPRLINVAELTEDLTNGDSY